MSDDQTIQESTRFDSSGELLPHKSLYLQELNAEVDENIIELVRTFNLIPKPNNNQ